MSHAVQATSPQVTGDLYAEVQTFYARQMRRVDSLDIEGFADTFTEDAEIVHAGGSRQRGRTEMIAGMTANVPRYEGIAPRHWFGHVLIESDAEDVDLLRVSYYTLVTLTGRDAKVSFQPTFLVEDELVRRNGKLLTRRRVIHQDAPA